MLRTTETALVSRTINGMVRDLLDVFIVYTLNGRSRSGYDIKKTLAKQFGVKISYGSLYPHLHSLESSGIMSVEVVPHSKAKDLTKKQYSLTTAGREALQANVEALSRITLTLQLELAGASRELVAREIAPQPVDSIATILRSRGFKVQSNVSLKGRSGNRHEVDLFAVKGEGDSEQRLLFGFSLNDSPVETREVTDLYTLGYDLGSTTIVLIAVPGLTQEAKRLTEFYGIKALETANVNEVAQGQILGLEEILRQAP